MLHGGRWNSRGLRVIYAAETSAGALLEVLVHSNLSQPPRNHKVIPINVPDKVVIETLSITELPDWYAEDMGASRAFGDRWIRENRTAVLRVPSVITTGRENNLLFNPFHSQFALIKAGEPEPAEWDVRLFRH
jgi:RES domain-containing protein